MKGRSTEARQRHAAAFEMASQDRIRPSIRHLLQTISYSSLILPQSQVLRKAVARQAPASEFAPAFLTRGDDDD